MNGSLHAENEPGHDLWRHRPGQHVTPATMTSTEMTHVIHPSPPRAVPAPASTGAPVASGDLALSPRTGWTRGTWLALADRLLAGVRPYASSGHARITLPGPAGGYGTDVDGLEGFARTFLLAGFRLAGERGADPGDLAGWYAAGLAAGTDPHAPDRWVRLDEHAQAKVEAASIALVLDLTRPWIWDRLDPVVQEQVVEYLAPAVGDSTYPRINWVWFRVVVQTFLRSVGGPFSASDIAEDLATHDSFVRADGWLSDGPERAYDHYVGWALHLYPTLWARMSGAAELRETAARRADTAALDRYLTDAVHLVGADGSPLVQGRSLVYRFAAAAPFWVGAMAEVPSLSPGLLRRAASGVVRHFVDAGAPDHRGLLTLGWHGAWPRLAQAYSGPGSPYWAAKGLLGIALPAEHPVWTATEEPLPVERGDTLRAVRAPGWLVSGTASDGVVRVVNHGTDHAAPGSTGADSPLYAGLTYSTATAPLLDAEAWTDPLDGAVVLLDAAGRATHRTGFSTLDVRVDGPVGVAASRARVHWVLPDARQQDHGDGLEGTADPAGTVVTVSLVRGPWEVRLVRVEAIEPAAGAAGRLRLRIGGWAVAGAGAAGEARVPGDRAAGHGAGGDGAAGGTTVPGSVAGPAGRAADVHAGALVSAVMALNAPEPVEAGTTTRPGASPLGEPAQVPWLTMPVRLGEWVAALVTVTRTAATAELVAGPTAGPGSAQTGASAVRVTAGTVCVTWPDGLRTRTDLALDPPVT